MKEHTNDYYKRCMLVLKAIYDNNEVIKKTSKRDSAPYKAARVENEYLRTVKWLLEDEGFLEDMEAIWHE